MGAVKSRWRRLALQELSSKWARRDYSESISNGAHGINREGKDEGDGRAGQDANDLV